jgi:hypothetical protein
MTLNNWDKISTWQEVEYWNSSNTCKQHCMEPGNNKVCGKWELCCNKIKDETIQEFNLTFAV